MVLRKVKKVIAKSSKKRMAKAKKTNKSESKPFDAEMFNHMIRERAYYLWEEKGNPPNSDFDIWIQAEKEMTKKEAKSK